MKKTRILAFVATSFAAFISSFANGQSCFCWTNQDCINYRSCPNTCERNWLTGQSRCVDRSIPPPTPRPPTVPPPTPRPPTVPIPTPRPPTQPPPTPRPPTQPPPTPRPPTQPPPTPRPPTQPPPTPRPPVQAPVTTTRTCLCWTNQDCINNSFCPNMNTCERDWLTGQSRCVNRSVPTTPRQPTFPTPPTPRPPTRAPVRPPTQAPVKPPTRAPVKPPTRAPVRPPTRPPFRIIPRPTVPPVQGGSIQVIPSVCQVDFLIGVMDGAVAMNKAIAPQWLRLAFHDAGTFDVQIQEGGANGCLLTNNAMREQPENHNLDLAIETLRFVQTRMINSADPIRLSNADLIQFAGFFVAVRQRGTPGLNQQKRDELKAIFEWGRPDEQNCKLEWTLNLPGFQLGADATNIPQRCMFAGREIREKMMTRNGFTAREAAVLIGAHTIGLTRNVFGPSEVAPWVQTGADAATPEGPIFDNGFHKFLSETLFATTINAFARNRFPFDEDFSNWFRSNPINVNHLDTDIVLAFGSQDTNVYPHFDTFSQEFASSNSEFINSFMAALSKMSKLGVTTPLRLATTGCTLRLSSGRFPDDPLPPPTLVDTFASELLASIDTAKYLLDQTLIERQDEIANLTTRVYAGP